VCHFVNVQQISGCIAHCTAERTEAEEMKSWENIEEGKGNATPVTGPVVAQRGVEV